MKIDLKKISELEKKYSNSPVALDIFHRMIHVVFEEPTGNLPGAISSIYAVALNTLEELEVLKN